jgi:hypothetical protein
MLPRPLAPLALLAVAAACTSQGKPVTMGETPKPPAQPVTMEETPKPPAQPAGSTAGGAASAGAEAPGPATSSAAPAPASAGRGETPDGFCAPAAVAVSPAPDGAFTVTTAHYELYAEVPPDRAAELGRLLEAAFPAFEAWFQAAPPGAGLLQVKLYATEDAWAAGLGADGIAAPSEAGGYYSSTTKTAYLYVQGNPAYTRSLLLHEATHQFHELARTRGRRLPFWYVEGHAEHLSRHDWDGRCVRLGTTPLLSWEDLPALALTESRSRGIDVPAVVSGAEPPTRAAAWALFRYLDTGPRHDAFRAFRDRVDAPGGADPGQAFAALVADPATLSAPLAAWLPGAAEPMRPVFTEWISVGPRAVTGESPGYFSMALLKRPAAHFEARYDAPRAAAFAVGLVLGYEDDQTYEAILVSSDGRLRTFTVAAGDVVWRDAGTAPADAVTMGTSPPNPAGSGFLSVDFARGTARITVNGVVTTRALTALPAAAGLAVSDATVTFHDLAWR